MAKTLDHIHLHHDDLPADVDLGKSVAIDTETMGLNPHRDRLCLVQMSSGDGQAHLVKIGHPKKPAPRLAALLADEGVEKLFILHGLISPRSAMGLVLWLALSIAPKLLQNYAAPIPTAMD